MSDEYRVVWRREGRGRSERRYAAFASAERQAERVRTSDPHWRCDDDFDDGRDCDPPIVAGPTITRRTVGDWEAA